MNIPVGEWGREFEFEEDGMYHVCGVLVKSSLDDSSFTLYDFVKAAYEHGCDNR